MRKKISIAIFSVLLVITGCNGILGYETSDGLIPKDKIYVSIDVVPHETLANGTTSYEADIDLLNLFTPGRMGHDALADSNVTINGMPLTYTPTNSSFNARNIMLSPGDTVTVVIENEKIEKISQTMTVPDFNCTAMTFSPQFDPGVVNKNGEYTISWINSTTEGDYYRFGYMHYSADGNSSHQSVIYTDEKSVVLNDNELIEGNSPAPYINFSLSTVNKSDFSGYWAGSSMMVHAPNIIRIGNLSLFHENK